MAIETVLEHRFNGETSLLVDGLSGAKLGVLLPLVLVAGLPNTLENILVGHFVEDTIAGKSDKVVVFLDLELLDLRFSFDNIRVSSAVGQLGLWVSECTRDGESARKHSDWSNYVLWLLSFLRTSLLLVILNGLRRSRLIDLTAGFDDSIVFEYVRGLVISAQRHDHLSSVDGNDCPRVSDVGAVAHITNDQDDNCAGAASVNDNLGTIVIPSLTHGQELFLCHPEATNDGFFGIAGEAVLLDDEVVQLVPEEFRASVSSVPIVHTKETALGPLLILPVSWLRDIQNDRHSVLVVVSDETLIGNCRVRPDDTVSLDGAFRGFLIRQYDSGSRLQRHLD